MKLNEMFMPFGKYHGRAVKDIPADYLWWCWDNVELRDPLREAIRQELFGDDSDSSCPSFNADDWYRRLSIEFHPDQGGSKQAMQAINRAHELLREMLP